MGHHVLFDFLEFAFAQFGEDFIEGFVEAHGVKGGEVRLEGSAFLISAHLEWSPG